MSSSISLSNTNLEFLRKQSKSLHQLVVAGDAKAIERVVNQMPGRDIAERFVLADAQCVIARELGHPSWPALKRAVETAGPELALSPEPPPLPEPTPTKLDKSKPSPQMGDAAVKAATGRDWAEWFRIFDEAGGANMNHQQIVAIARENGAGSWWQQMVTVNYEQVRGLRVKNQNCYGDFQVSSNKTIAAPDLIVFQAWFDNEIREQWLPGADLTIRKSTSPKSLRITWGTDQKVETLIYPAGPNKCRCSVECKGLANSEAVEERRAFWGAALTRLKNLVEG